MTRTKTMSPETMELHRDATIRLGRGGIVVRAERGTLLVTQSGDLEDHVLEAGQSVVLPRGGAAVAWALSDARVRVAPAARAGDVPELARCAA